MTSFNEFYDEHSDFVVQQAYRWVQKGRPVDYSLCWSMAMLIDENRTLERLAELDEQFTAAMAACAI